MATWTKATALSAGSATGTAPTAITDGIALGRMAGIRIAVANDSGQTISGAGKVDLWLWEPADGFWYFWKSLSITVAAGVARGQIFDLQEEWAASFNGYRAYALPNGVTGTGTGNITVRVDTYGVGSP